jgi:hypothetical protein
MVLVRDSELAIQVVGASVLLDAGVEVNPDGIGVTRLESQLVNGAREGLVDLKHDSCRKRAGILDGQVLGDGHCWHSLFPDIFEIKLGWDNTATFASHLGLLNVVE